MCKYGEATKKIPSEPRSLIRAAKKKKNVMEFSD